VVQREGGVVQREGEAKGKFKYCDSFESHEEGFERGKILFCPYGNVGTECKSRGFNGCLMMAFYFNKVNPITGEANTEESLNALIFGGNSDASVGVEKNYIAHVYLDGGSDDMSLALCDAKNQGLITIEALFKPMIDSDVKNICDASKETKKTDVAKSVLIGGAKFTGGLKLGAGGRWNAGVYVPDVPNSVGVACNVYENLKGSYSNIEDDSRRLKSFDSVELDKQTKATMAFVYASAKKYDEMRSELNLGTKIDDGLIDLFLKICSLRVLEQVQENVPEMEPAIAEEIASRETEEDVKEKASRVPPPENPSCCIIS
jgi:hypothetical protein